MLTETLTPQNFFQRMQELREAGAVIFRMSQGKTNSEWLIQYEVEAHRSEPQPESSSRQSELF